MPDGKQAAETLANSGQAVEFLKDQYRHCKTLLILERVSLLQKGGIAESLPSGEPDPGLLVLREGGASAFIAALAKHRHAERDRDPPAV